MKKFGALLTKDDYYYPNIICRNCGYQGQGKIKKGTLVYLGYCCQCECRTIELLKELK
jgi:hypothetical protein